MQAGASGPRKGLGAGFTGVVGIASSASEKSDQRDFGFSPAGGITAGGRVDGEVTSSPLRQTPVILFPSGRARILPRAGGHQTIPLGKRCRWIRREGSHAVPFTVQERAFVGSFRPTVDPFAGSLVLEVIPLVALAVAPKKGSQAVAVVRLEVADVGGSVVPAVGSLPVFSSLPVDFTLIGTVGKINGGGFPGTATRQQNDEDEETATKWVLRHSRIQDY